MAPIFRPLGDGNILEKSHIDFQASVTYDWLLGISVSVSMVVLVSLMLLILSCACCGVGGDDEDRRARNAEMRRFSRKPEGGTSESQGRERDRHSRSPSPNARHGEKPETNAMVPSRKGFEMGQDKHDKYHDRGHHDINNKPHEIKSPRSKPPDSKHRGGHDSPHGWRPHAGKPHDRGHHDRGHHDRDKDQRGEKGFEMERGGKVEPKKPYKRMKGKKIQWSKSNLLTLMQIEQERVAKAEAKASCAVAGPAPSAPPAPTGNAALPSSPEFATDVTKGYQVAKTAVGEMTGVSSSPLLHAPGQSVAQSTAQSVARSDAHGPTVQASAVTMNRTATATAEQEQNVVRSYAVQSPNRA